MERVHYRRVADGTRPSPGKGDGQPSGFWEKLIIQTIAAALIMAAVMGVSLLDYDFTLAARGGIRQALEGQTTFDGIVTDIRAYADSWFLKEEPVIPEAEIMPQIIPNAAVNGDESKTSVSEPPLLPKP